MLVAVDAFIFKKEPENEFIDFIESTDWLKINGLVSIGTLPIAVPMTPEFTITYGKMCFNQNRRVYIGSFYDDSDDSEDDESSPRHIIINCM